MPVIEFLNKVNDVILNPLILLLFAVALLIFFWGLFQFINSETVDSGREKGKRKIMWGIFGMFVMISAKGLIMVVLNTFGLKPPNYPGLF